MIFREKSDDKSDCTVSFREKNFITSYKDDLRKMSRIFNHQKSMKMASSKARLMKFFMSIYYFIPKNCEKSFFLLTESIKTCRSSYKCTFWPKKRRFSSMDLKWHLNLAPVHHFWHIYIWFVRRKLRGTTFFF